MATKASQDGLEESQIRVFGLPIRPSFARAVLVKVCIMHIKVIRCDFAFVVGIDFVFY